MGPEQEYSTTATYTVDGTGTGGFLTAESGRTLRISEGVYTPWVELDEVRSLTDTRVDTLESRLDVLEQSVYYSEEAITRLTEALTKLCGIFAEQCGVEPPECDMSAIMNFIDSIPVKEADDVQPIFSY